MKTGLVIHGLIAAFILWFVPLGFLSLMSTAGGVSLGYVAIGCLVGGFMLGASNTATAKVWRYALLFGAAFVFIAPVASCMGASMSIADKVKDSTLAGAAIIGVGLGSMFLGFFSTIIAIVYLIAGLLVGRDPKTIIVQHAPLNPPGNDNANR